MKKSFYICTIKENTFGASSEAIQFLVEFHNSYMEIYYKITKRIIELIENTLPENEWKIVPGVVTTNHVVHGNLLFISITKHCQNEDGSFNEITDTFLAIVELNYAEAVEYEN